MSIQLASELDQDEATRRVRLLSGLGELATVTADDNTIVLLDEDSDGVMVASRADYYERMPQSNPFWIGRYFYSSAGTLRVFIGALADALIARGEPDTPVRWRIQNADSVERAIDRMVPPRIVLDPQGRQFRETTARETKEHLRGL